MFDELFETLDLGKDGLLSRAELHRAAKRFGWHWQTAPLFAVLDLLTTTGPVSRNTFVDYMQQMDEDPLGPYGKVLLKVPYASIPPIPGSDSFPENKYNEKDIILKNPYRMKQEGNGYTDGISLLDSFAGSNVAKNYQGLLNALETLHVSTDDAALLIIDPQRSFTRGAWMQAIGTEAEVDIKPIELAFDKCAELLKKYYGCIDVMFTRCPFPPDSYGWDDQLAEIIDRSQLYFIKPGNSVLFPHTNGFRQWVDWCINSGKEILVFGGCTLNSCLRVSSIETFEHFKKESLQVVVDLNLSGARMRNFIKSPEYNGLSAVESAVRQMTAAGVKVVQHVSWETLSERG